MPGPTAYSGELKIRSLDGTLHVIDVLDIKSTKQVFQERKQAYSDAEIIKLVDLPQG